MRITVTGATGAIGGQVVRLLADEGTHQVVALTRRPVASPVDNVVADYGDAEALRAVLKGTDTLVFVSSDGETAHVVRHHENLIRAARENSVKHIVALSGLDADIESPFCYAVSYAYTERDLRESGCPVSIVRASIFSEFFGHFLRGIQNTGKLRLPASDGRISLVSRADVGRCLAALAVAGPTGRTHDITGPEALDMPAVAAIAGSLHGTPVEYVEVTPEEFQVELIRGGEEPWWTYAFSTMFESVRQQRWAAVDDEVTRLTGTGPLSFRDVLAASTMPS